MNNEKLGISLFLWVQTVVCSEMYVFLVIHPKANFHLYKDQCSRKNKGGGACIWYAPPPQNLPSTKTEGGELYMFYTQPLNCVYIHSISQG